VGVHIHKIIVIKKFCFLSGVYFKKDPGEERPVSRMIIYELFFYLLFTEIFFSAYNLRQRSQEGE
jgi:hypothetical protein